MSTKPQVQINTSYGPFIMELYPDQAPKTVSNFLSYVDKDFYTGTLFHRVMNQFVVQGGGMNQKLQFKTTDAAIELESNTGLSNLRGTVAMARTNEPNSATSQFFVNTVDNTNLNYQSSTSPGYAVFGKVIDGLDVIDKIEKAKVANVTISGTPYQNFPYPYLISIYGAERYEAADNPTLTSHTLKGNAYGIAIAQYSGARTDYGVKLTSNNTISVTKLGGSYSPETVTKASRLEFTDGKFAYDLNGNAGKTALLINAAFGLNALQPNIVSTGLDLFDQGKSMQSVAALAVQTPLFQSLAGGSDNASFVKAVYRNVTGSSPDATTQAIYQGMLDRGETTQGDLLAAAAVLQANANTVDLVGLANSGLAYL